MWASGPKRLTSGWSHYPIFFRRTGFPLTVFSDVDSSGGFTNPGVSGAGDLVSARANLTGQPLTTFNPRTVQSLTGDLSGTNSGNFYFNPAAFTAAQLGSLSDPCPTPSPTCFPSAAQVIANPSLLTYGTAPSSLLRGPGRTNLDMSLVKGTAITEKLHLEIRVDAFNLLNHAEFADPVTNISSPEFSQIIATGSPTTNQLPARIPQLEAKFTFESDRTATKIAGSKGSVNRWKQAALPNVAGRA